MIRRTTLKYYSVAWNPFNELVWASSDRYFSTVVVFSACTVTGFRRDYFNSAEVIWHQRIWFLSDDVDCVAVNLFEGFALQVSDEA